MKIAVITCYFQPDYVRARTLRAAAKAYPGAKVIVVKNKHKGLLRYAEITWKLFKVKTKHRPDVYLLTFRGQEILPLVLLIAGLKPVIFDEFIIPMAYVTKERHKMSVSKTIKYFLTYISEPLYKFCLRSCKVILADTEAHAELSAKTSHVNFRQYGVIPVGADETIFKPNTELKATLVKKPFVVFFYGLMMTPLHGLSVILEAAEVLKDNTDITFKIIGGSRSTAKLIRDYNDRGANISYLRHVEFEEFPKQVYDSALCIGGPLGGTEQAQNVITGKTYQFLALSAPTIVGDSISTKPFFKDKDNALVIDQDSSSELVKAITWAFNNRDELVEIGRRGRKLYDREFSSEVIAGNLKTILDEIA